MKLAPLIGWGLGALVLALAAALALGPLRIVEAPPDLWPGGSDARGIAAWIAGLGPEGLAAMRGGWLLLDCALALALALWLLWALRPFPGIFGMVSLLAVLAALALDLAENWLVQQLLAGGPSGVMAMNAEALTRLTQGKFLAWGLALALALRQSARRAAGADA